MLIRAHSLPVLILWVTLLGSSNAAIAEAQPYLEERVQTLEKQLRELNQRVEQMEQRPATAKVPAYTVPLEQANTSTVIVTPGWQSAASWKKLRRGMSQIQVTQLLGEPARRSGDRYAERWQYPNDSAWVEFDQVSEVSGWRSAELPSH